MKPHPMIWGGGNEYDSLEFITTAIYENQIAIQRSEIELLEYNNGLLLEGTSYIHEGAGEAIKNFFKKIKDAISKLIHKVIDFFKRIFKKGSSDYESAAKEVKDSKMTIADVNAAISSSTDTTNNDSSANQWYHIEYSVNYLSESMNQVTDMFDVKKYLDEKEKVNRGLFKSTDFKRSITKNPTVIACARITEYIKTRFKIQTEVTSIPDLHQILFDKIVKKVNRPDPLTTDDLEGLAHVNELRTNFENMIIRMKKMNAAAESNFNRMADAATTKLFTNYYKQCAVLASQYTQIITVMLTTLTNIIILKMNQTKRLARKAVSAHKIASRADTKIVKAVS